MFPKILLAVLLSYLLLPLQAQTKDANFTVHHIPDSIFSLMQGRSYPKGCTVPRSSLRYLRVKHVDLHGRERQGELVCHQDIATDLIAIFRALYEARYPIERMELIDRYGANDDRSMRANNSSAFNYRHVAGTRVLSNHSYGRAIDINPLYNPYVSGDGRRVQPANARPYAQRSQSFPYKITQGDLCYQLFKQYGFTWGGDWRSKKDYQHFEKAPSKGKH